jgi:alkanesulfonate monooxygenase SsuD/methylene tetrahydromethanopterin reductase-like flavin-dependent oxidoreductase (luciferase family)
MKLGITLPLIDIKGDPATVRDFAQAAEGLGYHHLAAPDHVLGVNVASRPDWGARNTSKDFFHDPFVMFGFLAACTKTIEFSTQVMILPQRQTALVAKQAASLDVLLGNGDGTPMNLVIIAEKPFDCGAVARYRSAQSLEQGLQDHDKRDHR